jgi:hypothetical protein
MSSSSRAVRHSLLSFLFLWAISTVCVARGYSQTNPQFIQPTVEATNGRVASFVAGQFNQSGITDILYINSATAVGTSFQVTVGELLNQPSPVNLNQNQIVFSNVLNVSAALGDFDNDGLTDYAFALSPTAITGNNLCVYYGSGAGLTGSSYSGGNAYPPTTGKSGCISLPIKGGLIPSFSYIAAAPFKNGNLP